MVFSSSVFLFVFLPIVLIGYIVIPGKLQNIWLLLSSIFFYCWGGMAFVPIILFSVFINYIGGICIDSENNEKKRKCLLVLFLGLNLLNLGYWKYTNFIVEIIEKILSCEIKIDAIVLPIGISFYTFQGISYIIDVFRREVKVQKNPLYVALYICLFPQLIAGPIVRYADIEKQIADRKKSLDRFEEGIIRFVVGLGKKAILANEMGQISEQIFQSPCEENTVIIAWIGAISYTMQIYFDFSGYSDMAIGLGKIFGFDFPENFNYPYISKSVSEFWRRWHISLSGWFRDYVYIPLGGNRKGNVYVNLFIVFLLTGIWHGANWTFIVWGIYYGVFILIERYLKNRIKIEFPMLAKWLYTMLVTVIGWVLFNSPSIEYAVKYIRSMFGMLPLGKVRYMISWYVDRYTLFIFIIAVIAATPVGMKGWKKLSVFLTTECRQILSYILTVVLLVLSMMYVMTSTYNPFIYFQF